MVYVVSERPAVGLSGPMADPEVLSSEDTAKSRLALYSCKGGCQNKSDGWCAAGRWRGIKAGLGRAAGQYGEVSLLPIQQHRISR